MICGEGARPSSLGSQAEPGKEENASDRAFSYLATVVPTLLAIALRKNEGKTRFLVASIFELH